MSFHQLIEPARASRFLIVQTGSTLPELRARHDDFPEWFRRGLGLTRAGIDVVRVDIGEALPDASAYAGLVVTGSSAMVSDREPWSERIAAWLRGALEAGFPVLGVCYGHQLLAHALGGHVGYHPRGPEVGTVAIEILHSASDDALLCAAPASFLAHASHRQSVLKLPPGAVSLARSAHDPNHVVRYTRTAWGLQFHPEFSAAIMRGYLNRRDMPAGSNRSSGSISGRMHAPAPHARRLLRRFHDVALAARVQGAIAA